jgi:hypothetical protein
MELDLSQCSKLDDAALKQVVFAAAKPLRVLKLAECTLLSDRAFALLPGNKIAQLDLTTLCFHLALILLESLDLQGKRSI